MSRYSGKCDLYDHIAGCGGWFDRNGKPVKFGDPDVHCYYSDEWLDFLAFKKLTGGVLHQHKKIKLTPWNHEEVKKLCPEFDYQEHIRVIPDKRVKSGQREEKYLTYTYWNKEYTLKELNKRGIYITIDIKFDTLLDLIPYYPYIVSMSCSNNGKQTVYIAQESFVDEERDGHLEHGYYSDFWQYYKKQLQKHYQEVVLEYFNPTGREIEEDITFYPETDDNKIKYIGRTLYPIDENIEVKWITNKTHWTSPKVVDEYRLEMSKEDYENYLGSKIKVYYAKKKDYQLRLD